jgi:hypothetical protein
MGQLSMNIHEEAVIKTFVEPSRRERFLSAVANPKKRSTFTSEFNHLRSRFLVPTYIKPVRGSDSLPNNLYGSLRNLGASETCWAIGGRFDGTEVELLKGLRDSGDGFLLSCVPGKLAFVKTEDEEFILHKKK